MATQPSTRQHRERRRAHPVPDPDSLAMDDRGTRTFRTAQSDPTIVPPDQLDNSPLILEDAPTVNIEDAPTIIREVPRRAHTSDHK